MDVTAIVSVVIGIVLWVLVATCLIAAVRSKALFREGAFEGARFWC
jgi:hypothetical protein